MKYLLQALSFSIISFLILNQYYEYMFDVNFNIYALRSIGQFGYLIAIGGPIFALSLLPVWFFRKHENSDMLVAFIGSITLLSAEAFLIFFGNLFLCILSAGACE